jgi:hypothetical protein
VGTPRAIKRNLTAEPKSNAQFDFPRPKRAGSAVNQWVVGSSPDRGAKFQIVRPGDIGSRRGLTYLALHQGAEAGGVEVRMDLIVGTVLPVIGAGSAIARPVAIDRLRERKRTEGLGRIVGRWRRLGGKCLRARAAWLRVRR